MRVTFPIFTIVYGQLYDFDISYGKIHNSIVYWYRTGIPLIIWQRKKLSLTSYKGVDNMQACKAYYNNGRFVPLGFGKLPEGTQAIITLLEEIPKGIDVRLKEFDSIMQAIVAANEEMPTLEPIRLREVEL